MAHMERRLARVATHLTRDEDQLTWVDVHEAMQRQQARARLALGTRLGVDGRDPRVVEAMTLLGGDDPARVAQDVETIARWRRQQGIPADTGDVRPRMTQRLDILVCRLHGP